MAREMLPAVTSPALVCVFASAAPAGRAARRALTGRASGAAASAGLQSWPARAQNSLLRELRAEPVAAPPHASREVRDAHYTRVRPTVPSPDPELVIHSAEVASALGLTADDCASEEFEKFFGGRPADDVETWATVYGASFGGRYGGQRGDGRAISVGQVNGLEVQLKGAGTTPYSRRFDGRAVLRSCVREFLASEAMAALGVPTTRSLCVVTTGDTVRRMWYSDEGYERPVAEPGAVGTRVAPAFLRFGQFELFLRRGENGLLLELATHALRREFGHLLVQEPEAAQSTQLCRMFEEVCERHALLVSEWLRVGYAQGNMNSDNSALGGVTLDYGPFGFMEKFQPAWNPWVGGGESYCFMQQPNAAATNLVLLSECFVRIVDDVGAAEGLTRKQRSEAKERIQQAVSSGFVDSFNTKHDDNCRRKLGLATWDEGAKGLWAQLYRLMASSSGEGVDFTLTFRSLSEATPPAPEAAEDELLRVVEPAALQPTAEWPAEHRAAWAAWASSYWARVAEEGRPAAERLREMSAANPKYILRNWMAAEAYDAAARGDYELVHDVHRVLASPYDAQGRDVDERWAIPTPNWARGKPGLEVMS